MTRIAVIGGGKIGEALLAGLLDAGHEVKDLVVSEPYPPRAEYLAGEFGVHVTGVIEAAEHADVIIVAVKPHDIDSVVGQIATLDLDRDREQMLVSVAAGVPTQRLEAKLPAGFPVVRVMPNTPMLVGEGMTVVSAGRHAKQKHLDLVSEIFRAVGKVLTLKESQLDAVTAVSGSGPAYFFLVVEAMVDGGVALGLSRQIATELVVQTLIGSGAMLAKSPERAVELRAAVTSPGGTTAAALRSFEQAGLRSAFIEGLFAAHDRSVQQGRTKE